MPVPVKIVFSLVVLAVAFVAYFVLGAEGEPQNSSAYVALFLGFFAVFSFWIFPEVSNKK